MRVDPLQILTKLAAVQNIPTRRVTPPFEGLEEFDYGLRRSLDPQFDWAGVRPAAAGQHP